MRPQSLEVSLGERSYPIHIGAGVLQSAEHFQPHLSHQIMVVTNETVAPLYLDRLCKTLKEASVASTLHHVILPDGEAFKTLDTLNQIFDELLGVGANRGVTLVALGGGVVGDMTGFAAACYQRGVPFVQVPTTLLSQVDSSVGGKTGVNHPLGKNMIGAFYQPQMVAIDTDVINTLPERELSAGLAEVIKYGLIADADFFDWLEANMVALLARDPRALTQAIRRSCEIKALVVSEDEKESGRRAILNLGHTYGHAIEAHLGYGKWLHGEAVGAGMVMACQLSESLGWVSAEVTARAVALIEKAKLPAAPPRHMSGEDFRRYMKLDKKVQNSAIRLVLLKSMGDAIVTSDYDAGIFDQQLASLSH